MFNVNNKNNKTTFKVHNKDPRRRSVFLLLTLNVVLVFLLLTYFTFSSVSVVDFEQLNVSYDVFITDFEKTFHTLFN